MRTEQKLILAVGVLAGGFALSLPFRREAPPARTTKTTQPGFSRDLNLTLRHDSGTLGPNRPKIGQPLPPPHARITAVPDEERAAAQKKKAVPAAPIANAAEVDIPKADSEKAEAASVSSGATEAKKAEVPSDAAPISEQPPARPNGRIRNLKPATISPGA